MSHFATENFEPVAADFADAFDDWIAGATVAKRSVPIYGKPGLYAEFEDLERRLAKAEELEKHGSEMAGSETSKIRARMQEIYEEHQASHSTWIVRALDEDERAALDHADEEQGLPALTKPVRDPEPEAPEPLPAKHTEQQAKSHTIALNEYEKAKAAWDAESEAFDKAMEEYADEVNLRGIAKAVERIEFANGRTKDGITVAQLRTLRKRLGTRQVMSLLAAAMLAAAEEPEIPAPFWPSGDSEGDQT